jgi:hypothetical protein
MATLKWSNGQLKLRIEAFWDKTWIGIATKCVIDIYIRGAVMVRCVWVLQCYVSNTLYIAYGVLSAAMSLCLRVQVNCCPYALRRVSTFRVDAQLCVCGTTPYDHLWVAWMPKCARNSCVLLLMTNAAPVKGMTLLSVSCVLRRFTFGPLSFFVNLRSECAAAIPALLDGGLNRKLSWSFGHGCIGWARRYASREWSVRRQLLYRAHTVPERYVNTQVRYVSGKLQWSPRRILMATNASWRRESGTRP